MQKAGWKMHYVKKTIFKYQTSITFYSNVLKITNDSIKNKLHLKFSITEIISEITFHTDTCKI